MRSINETFYKTKEWKQCRAAYLRSQNYLCERCRNKGKHVPARIVHHKEHLTAFNVEDPKIAYGFNNLEALCLDCHNKEHFSGEEEQPKRWHIDRRTGKVVGGD